MTLSGKRNLLMVTYYIFHMIMIKYMYNKNLKKSKGILNTKYGTFVVPKKHGTG
jgi:hypothetical protein